MGGTRISLVVILAEDELHDRLIRRYIGQLKNYENCRIITEPLPSGRGCGEQWVRLNYCRCVKAYRGRQANTALVVAIDADKGSVETRLSQFRQALLNDSVPDREPTDLIAHLIPKRNMETWILCLNGINVDEESDYSKRAEAGTREAIKRSAERMYYWSRDNTEVPTGCIPSLLAGLAEVRRLEVKS